MKGERGDDESCRVRCGGMKVRGERGIMKAAE